MKISVTLKAKKNFSKKTTSTSKTVRRTRAHTQTHTHTHVCLIRSKLRVPSGPEKDAVLLAGDRREGGRYSNTRNR